MEGIIDLHHDIMFFLVFVVVFVLYLIVAIMISSSAKTVAILPVNASEKEIKAVTVTPYVVDSHNTALEIV